MTRFRFWVVPPYPLLFPAVSWKWKKQIHRNTDKLHPDAYDSWRRTGAFAYFDHIFHFIHCLQSDERVTRGASQIQLFHKNVSVNSKTLWWIKLLLLQSFITNLVNEYNKYSLLPQCSIKFINNLNWPLSNSPPTEWASKCDLWLSFACYMDPASLKDPVVSSVNGSCWKSWFAAIQAKRLDQNDLETSWHDCNCREIVSIF
jgi:hypothetical protein